MLTYICYSDIVLRVSLCSVVLALLFSYLCVLLCWNRFLGLPLCFIVLVLFLHRRGVVLYVVMHNAKQSLTLMVNN